MTRKNVSGISFRPMCTAGHSMEKSLEALISETIYEKKFFFLSIFEKNWKNPALNFV
jgi:hypothetical protein